MGILEFLLNRSRELRGDQTPAEEILWSRLRNRAFGGIKFRRQHVIGEFIVDLYAPEFGLVIELDGVTHVDKKQVDRERDEALQAMGLTVLRIWNTEIYEDLESVLEGIGRVCDRIRAGTR